MLYKRAEAYLDVNGVEGLEEPGAGTPAGGAAPANAPTPPPAAPAPAPASGTLPTLTMDAEAVEQFKSVVGDDGYTKIVEPMLKHAQQQAVQITTLAKSLKELTQQINYQANNTLLDGLNDSRIGNSRNTLNPGQQEARAQVMGFAIDHLSRNPGDSPTKALEVAHATFITLKNRAGRSAGGAAPAAHSPARQRQIGVVPDRTVGVSSAPGGKSKAAVMEILSRLGNG